MKKKTIKIGFRYFWKGFDPENNLFTNLLRKNYEVIISENPDYLFYSVYSEIKKVKDLSKKGDLLKKMSPKLHKFVKKAYIYLTKQNNFKRPIPEGDFIKIFYTPENVKPNMDECDWAFSFYYDEEFNHPRHLRLPNYKFEELKGSLIKGKIDFDKLKKQKKKFCNFIYSQEVDFRNDFFKKLSKYKKVDSPGRCMTNMSPIGNYNSPKSSRQSKNWIKEKFKFLKHYKFTIAFENISFPGYTTEKIYHAMLAKSIPIYFGNPLINRDFNPKSFINCHEFKDFNEVIKRIIDIDTNDKLYKKVLKEPWFQNNKLSKYMDNKRILKRFKEIFGD